MNDNSSVARTVKRIRAFSIDFDLDAFCDAEAVESVEDHAHDVSGS